MLNRINSSVILGADDRSFLLLPRNEIELNGALFGETPVPVVSGCGLLRVTKS